MGTTPTYALPYPELTDQANVPADMKELADALDALMKSRWGDTGWVEGGTGSTVFAANATNFTLLGSRARKIGNQVHFYINGNMKVASSSPGTTGDIANLTLGGMAGVFVPASNLQYPVSSGSGGRVVAGYVDGATGSLSIGSIGGSAALAVGENLLLLGSYWMD